MLQDSYFDVGAQHIALQPSETQFHVLQLGEIDLYRMTFESDDLEAIIQIARPGLPDSKYPHFAAGRIKYSFPASKQCLSTAGTVSGPSVLNFGMKEYRGFG